MAKESEKPEEELEEVAEDIEPSKKKGKATKAKAPKAASAGQLPLLLIIGGALGGVVMIIVSVIIGTVIAQKLFPPITGVAPADAETEASAEHAEGGHAPEKLDPVPDSDFEEVEGAPTALLADGSVLTFNTGALSSNPKGSNQFCLLNLAVDYKPYYVEQLTEKGFLTAGGTDAHGNPEPPGVDVTNPLYLTLEQAVKSEMMLFISSKTTSEFQSMQSTGVLADSVQSALKKPFKEVGLQIGKVRVLDFKIANG